MIYFHQRNIRKIHFFLQSIPSFINTFKGQTIAILQSPTNEQNSYQKFNKIVKITISTILTVSFEPKIWSRCELVMGYLTFQRFQK